VPAGVASRQRALARLAAVTVPTGRDAHDREDSLVRGLLTGVAAFRGLAWAWMAVLLAVNRSELRSPGARPWVALALVAVALAVTVTAWQLLRTDAGRLLTLPAVAAELAVGFALEVGDQLAYHGVPHSQSLGSAWPLAGVMTAGIAFGGRGGLLAGVVVASGRAFGELADPTAWTKRDTVAAVSTVVLYALAGGVAGLVTARLRESERRASLAQASEEVARTLHDGVLQTLAVVQRRSRDPDLSRLAREQERELREYLSGTAGAVGAGGDLGSRLRSAAARFEDRYGGTARVAVADDVPALDPRALDALAGAVGEALANAGKHGDASTVTVFAEPADGGVFCSVKDDGSGFDLAATPEGTGLRRSVRDRIAEVGGRVEIDGRPGRGTEVRCWVPGTRPTLRA
jgi:signal transduction histidine kinase